jgi:aminocarboxymuconate-semialdehyde decarboxylase
LSWRRLVQASAGKGACIAEILDIEPRDKPMTLVIDVHTHMISRPWLDMLKKHGGPRYSVKEAGGIPDVIHMDGAAFMTPMAGMFDWDMRIKAMDKGGVDISVVSLTCPSVYWGGEDTSATTARMMNDDFASAQAAHPDRIRWYATLPWEYPQSAVAELERAVAKGAVGVMVLANIVGASLTAPRFAPIWEAIDRQKLPVLVHPTAPPGVGEMDMATHSLTASIGFTFDTSLAIARCISDGFLDRYPNLRLIASHGGGALPYLAGRLDICHAKIPACSARAADKPSNYLRRIYVDSVVFAQNALQMCVDTVGPDNVLYGSDYPHNIGDITGCLGRVNSLAEGVRQAVRGRNAQRIFNIT